MSKVPYGKDHSIASRLKFARVNAGMTQKELSDRIGINSRRYSKYEIGENVPPPDVMASLCRVLDVTSDFLIGLSDEYAPKDRKGNDYICLMGSDGSRKMYNIPPDMRDRVASMLMAGFPNLMSGEE